MSRSRLQYRLLALLLVLATFPFASPLTADWLVTRDGQRIETEGPWTPRGRMVVFTRPGGTLSSIRLDEVDLEASRELTRRAAEHSSTGPAAPEPAERPPAMVLTNRDVAPGEEGAQGIDALVEKLRDAHRYQDVGMAMALVNWQDVPDGMRAYLESQFDDMMRRTLVDVRLEEVAEDDNLLREQDGVTYEPNLDVTHRLTLEFAPDPGIETDTLSLYAGTRLGAYFIASARPAENLP